MKIKLQELKQWKVGQMCKFGVLMGEIIEIDVNHICPILWRTTINNEIEEHRFYANGEVCRSILTLILTPV